MAVAAASSVSLVYIVEQSYYPGLIKQNSGRRSFIQISYTFILVIQTIKTFFFVDIMYFQVSK